MASYMPQDVFNMCAVTAAGYHGTGKLSIEQYASLISSEYRKSYVDDGFESDIVSAAYKVVAIMEREFPNKPIYSATKQIQYCIKTYRQDGKKRGIFNGAWFNRQKTPLPNRVSQCAVNVIAFHVGTLNGAFELAPEGWSL